jgi:hypothetical protein
MFRATEKPPGVEPTTQPEVAEPAEVISTPEDPAVSLESLEAPTLPTQAWDILTHEELSTGEKFIGLTGLATDMLPNDAEGRRLLTLKSAIGSAVFAVVISRITGADAGTIHTALAGGLYGAVRTFGLLAVDEGLEQRRQNGPKELYGG